MKTVYVLTKGLRLYADANSFFSPQLTDTINLSAQSLNKAIPSSAMITVYFDQVSAEKELYKTRKMALVDDLDNPGNIKGVTYRSTITPVILEVPLKNDLVAEKNETQREISRELLDLAIPAKVIHCEKDYKGTIPTSLIIEPVNEQSNCIMM